jgi:hypothetical protein
MAWSLQKSVNCLNVMRPRSVPTVLVYTENKSPAITVERTVMKSIIAWVFK